ELAVLPRLGDELVDAAGVDGAEQALDVGVGSEQDADDVGSLLRDAAEQLGAGHLRHPLIGDHHAHLLLGQASERLGARARRQDGKLAVEELGDQGENLRLIVDDEKRRAGGFSLAHLVSTAAGGGSSGRRMVNVAPAPGALVTWRSPPRRGGPRGAGGGARAGPRPAVVGEKGPDEGPLVAGLRW